MVVRGRFSVHYGHMANTTERIADKVRGFKAEKRLTEQRVADIVGLGRSAVVQRMNGRVPWTATELFELAQATGTPVSRFFPDVTVAVAA